MRTEFTRLTVVGASRKAELVVPNDESVGALIPRLMDLLEEKAGSVARPLTLVRSTGEQLDASLSPAEQQVTDGELLRLVRQDEAPPPPEVADVTDVLADSHADRRGLWSDTFREATGAVGIGGLSLAAAWSAAGADAADLLVWVLAALVVVAVIAGRMRARWVTHAGTAAAVGVSLPLAVALSDDFTGGALADAPAGAAVAFTALLAAALAQGVLALGLGVGRGRRPALSGGLLGVALSALPLLVARLGVGATEALAIGGVVAAVVCGLIPWYAMSVSGLTGLDDQVVEGRQRRRDSVLLTVNGAYRTLSWCAFAVAAPLAACASALTVSLDVWAASLGVAIAAITALRTRAFPLAAQAMALWAAAGIVVLAGITGSPMLPRGAEVPLLAGAALVTAVLVGVRPAQHQRASLRRLGNFMEALAVIALLPLLLGVFDVYTDLLGAF